MNIELNHNELIEIKESFIRVMDQTFKFFGKNNFRIPTDNSRGRINIAVMESVGHFFSSKDDNFLTNHKNKIMSDFSRLINDEKYLDAVKISTGDKKRVFNRFVIAAKILGDV